MNKKEEVKKLAEKFGYQDIREILDELENERLQNLSNLEKAKEYFKENILKHLWIDQHENHPHSLFFIKDNSLIMENDKKMECALVSYNVWDNLGKFNIDDDQISNLIQNLMQNRFDMKIFKPRQRVWPFLN